MSAFTILYVMHCECGVGGAEAAAFFKNHANKSYRWISAPNLQKLETEASLGCC